MDMRKSETTDPEGRKPPEITKKRWKDQVMAKMRKMKTTKGDRSRGNLLQKLDSTKDQGYKMTRGHS